MKVSLSCISKNTLISRITAPGPCLKLQRLFVEENLKGEVSASAPAFAAFLYFKLDEMNALSDEGISVDKR